MDRVEQLEIALMACMKEREQYARKLYRARRLMRDLMLVHTADMEAVEDLDSPVISTWRKADRFLGDSNII